MKRIWYNKSYIVDAFDGRDDAWTFNIDVNLNPIVSNWVNNIELIVVQYFYWCVPLNRIYRNRFARSRSRMNLFMEFHAWRRWIRSRSGNGRRRDTACLRINWCWGTSIGLAISWSIAFACWRFPRFRSNCCCSWEVSCRRKSNRRRRWIDTRRTSWCCCVEWRSGRDTWTVAARACPRNDAAASMPSTRPSCLSRTRFHSTDSCADECRLRFRLNSILRSCSLSRRDTCVAR